MKSWKLVLLLIPLAVVLLVIGYSFLIFDMLADLVPLVSVYGIIVFAYFGVRLLFHFLNKPYTKPFNISTSIVVPCYQENREVFVNCLKSCLKQKPLEVIVVDDGSKDLANYNDALALAKDHPKLVVLRQEKNQGKRHAQAVAFRIAKGDVLVTVDSDTVLEDDTLAELIKPFAESKIGAVAGQLSILNKTDNLLTRLLNIRYIVAGILERAAYSYFGVVNCTSGPLSAYRKTVVLDNLEDYLTQTHKGKNCTFGDDRRLTAITLREGYSVFFQKTAKAKTLAPTTFKGFTIQQLRWNRSFWRENYLALRWMWRRSAYLSFGTLMDMFLPFLYFGSLVWSISVSFTSFSLFLLFPLFITAPLMAFIRNFDYLRMTKAKDYALVPLYSWLYLIVLLPITFFAVFTTSQTGWGTR
ncbi:MAG: glycosyltransferase [Candidatus Bathyarchaeota archaeon]|nr:glycosyltransferase [Candidatus Bathyarchaeota archaeon]